MPTSSLSRLRKTIAKQKEVTRHAAHESKMADRALDRELKQEQLKSIRMGKAMVPV